MTIKRLEKLMGNLQHLSAFEQVEPHSLSRRYRLRKGKRENGWCSVLVSVTPLLHPSH